ncbi:MAG TPA: LacI family DNA-binding transcriptional regulator [Candidatus Desulfovibrio intestinavium]|uniref:LacI family DNA-binding transcriptional regulator n=1 Tax=Candidatus Desulfovibrio intestinavium TaxID=2838534 RepID=A0A9D2KRE6_9BACT|nr:LacI family DNA-binding transcriptional regulator [Candidatus Desulfovibrio intestinavium]
MSKLQHYGRGRADSKREIQRILDGKGKNFVDVAEVAGVTPQTVSATMNGFRHSPRVLDALRSFGIPERLLFDPRRAERAA